MSGKLPIATGLAKILAKIKIMASDGNLSPIQILDKVLYWFAMDIDDFVKTKSQSANSKVSKPEAITEIGRCYKELNTVDFLMYADLVIDKLVKDGHVISNEKQVGFSGQPIMYSISFEGKLFSKSGGYTQKEINENLAKEELRNDLALRKRNDHRLVLGTYLVAVAGLGLIIWEIYKHYFLHVD